MKSGQTDVKRESEWMEESGYVSVFGGFVPICLPCVSDFSSYRKKSSAVVGSGERANNVSLYFAFLEYLFF